jgi:hypothetical protein
MAVVFVKEQGGTYGGTSEWLGDESASRTWIVDTNSPMTSLDVIIGAQAFLGSTVPSPGQPLSISHPGVLATQFAADEDRNTSCSWTLTVDYAPRDGFNDEADNQLPPDQRNAEISWAWEKFSRTDDKDADGKAYVNSAADPLDSPPEYRGAYTVLNMRQYEQVFIPITIPPTTLTVNDAPFQMTSTSPLLPAGTILYEVGASNFAYVEGAYFYDISATMTYNPNGWNPVEVLDRGTRTRNFDGTTEITKDSKGVPTGKPVLLDGGGGELPHGSDPIFLEFNSYLTTDFSTLGWRLP